VNALTVDVVGLPAPQGSKRAFVVNGRPVMAESSKKVKPWRQDVAAAAAAAAEEARWQTPTGPVRVDITFYLPRPKYHYRSGARANELKPNAPIYVDKKPDKDKLERATCDALTTAGVIRDDAQIASGLVEKHYANGPTGARITIRPLDSSPAVASTPTAGEVPSHPCPASAPASPAGAGAGTTSEGALF
jgi:Holliday junction resolvase RusA-like endonuclease